MPNIPWRDAQKSRTASEKVYDVLHRNIINLNLTPGTLMSEKDISAKLGVSRTPVREAFIKLSNEGLVTVKPQKGSFVSKISLSRVKEERFLRESLETSVIEEIIQNIDDFDLTQLYENLNEQKKALDEGRTTDFMELDDVFHYMLCQLADKTQCYNVAMSFSSHYRRVRYLSMSVSGVSMSNYEHHKEILAKLEARDLESTEKIMKEHLRKLNIEKDIIFKKYTEYFEEEGNQNRGPEGFDDNNLFQDLNK